MKTILILLISISVSSCRYGVTYSELSALKDKKQKVESILSEELNTKNQRVLRDYFKAVKEIIYDFSTNRSMQSYMHRKFFRYFSEKICSDSLISKEHYDVVLSKCKVNDFFICSEEIKFLDVMLKKTSTYFTPKELSAITQSKNCKRLLSSFGVINE